MPGLRDSHGPLRLFIGPEDVSHLLSDGFTASNVDPGGHEACSIPIPKDLPNTIRGQHVLLTSGLSTVWEGRVSQPQRSLGHRTLIQCEGLGARFKDLSGSMVFVDRDLTRFQSPSYTRQVAIAGGNEQLGSSQVAADPTSNTPALIQMITDSWASPWIPLCEVWYDAGPQNLISQIYYVWNDPARAGDANWTDKVILSSDAQFSAFEQSILSTGASSGSGYYAPATPYRFASLEHYYAVTGAGVQGAQYPAYWRSLAVYGNHGLTLRGSDPGGFYPSDIFGWALGQIPDLQPGVIQQTDASGYIVPHYVQYTPVSLDTIVNDMAVAQGWHWGVWESLAGLTGDPRPRVDFRPRPAAGAFTAFCLRRDCDTFDIREDLSGQYNQCTVTFSQVDGTQGAATATTTNPILDQAGIPTRTLILNGGTMTPATAAVFAAEALALTNAQARVAGTMSIISPIDGGARAPWLLKAGLDRIRVGDAPSGDAFGSQSDYPVSRVETSISSSGISTAVEVGLGGASLVETLQSRLTSATALAAMGGA